VANYTATLNAITAKQNADLLNLRGIGAKEGVTETVYGGQQAEINREAAIQALPVQAQIATAQGNLQLAQDYLSQITTFTKEKLDNEYRYQTAVYNSVRGYADKAETKILDQRQKELDRQTKMADENLQTLNEYMIKAAESGQTGAISRLASLHNSIGDPNFTQLLASVVGSNPAIVKGVTTDTSKELSPSEVTQYQYDYPNAGIKIGDTKATAQAKINGNSASSNVVNQVLSSYGYSYEDAIKQVPKGKIGVIDKATSQFGSIPPEEFDANKYVRI
jgi:hypothetical protein